MAIAEACKGPADGLALGIVGLVMASAACAWSPAAARRLGRTGNLRLVLEQHAPILGRAVHVAAWLAPPVPADADDASQSAVSPPRELVPTLDWAGADILLVSIDALRADHLGAYGYSRSTTPNLDALAEESALFEHAYCPTPSTSYSVTSMMTGKPMRSLLSLGLGRDSETWATYLRGRGYRTAAFYPPAVFYIDADRFTEFEKTGLGFEHRRVNSTSAERRVREVEDYLATAGPEPLFLWVHLYEPHEPYVTHPGYDFGEGEARGRPLRQRGRLHGRGRGRAPSRRARGAARTTLAIVVTADHGEEFDDHGGHYHGTTCYEEQVRVPLLVSGPGVAPRRVGTVVQTIDLLPTVLSAVGIARPASVRGRDLGPVLVGTPAGPDPVLPTSRRTIGRSSLAATTGSSARGGSRRARSTTWRATPRSGWTGPRRIRGSHASCVRRASPSSGTSGATRHRRRRGPMRCDGAWRGRPTPRGTSPRCSAIRASSSGGRRPR